MPLGPAERKADASATGLRTAPPTTTGRRHGPTARIGPAAGAGSRPRPAGASAPAPTTPEPPAARRRPSRRAAAPASGKIATLHVQLLEAGADRGGNLIGLDAVLSGARAA